MTTIEYIKNVTVAESFTDSPGTLTKTLTGFPQLNPDEVVIRAINWNGEAADTFLYLIWSNITNDFIASFCGGSLAPHFPQTRIMLNAPIPNTLEFKLYFIVTRGAQPVAIPEVSGDLAIHLDFIKYHRTPIHA